MFMLGLLLAKDRTMTQALDVIRNELEVLQSLTLAECQSTSGSRTGPQS